MQNLSKEELKDLLLILAPLYLSAFGEECAQYGAPVKKLYAHIKIELKGKTSEYEYEEAMKDVMDYCRQIAELDPDVLKQTMADAAIATQEIAKKV